MLFTDTFVYIHQPKTGGTFVTAVLERIYASGTRSTSWWHRPPFHLLQTVRFSSLLWMAGFPPCAYLKTPQYGTLILSENKHGTCSQIPRSQRRKAILATVRRPHDWYVSQYEFGWWKRPRYLPLYQRVPGFEKQYPTFPELSFREYLTLTHAAFAGGRRRDFFSEDAPGLYTEGFIKFYFRNPAGILQRLDAHPIDSSQCADLMYPVQFILTDNLNEGLFEFLLSMGYARQDVDFIRAADRILPDGSTRRHNQPWQSYYSPELQDLIRKKDCLLFEMLPEFERVGPSARGLADTRGSVA